MVAHTYHCHECQPWRMHFSIPDGKQLMCIANILVIRGDGNYTYLHTVSGKEVTICHNLGWYVPRLPRCFGHANQRFIVNLHLVSQVMQGNYIHLTVPVKHTIHVTDSYKKEFFARLNRWNIALRSVEPETDMESNTPDSP